MFLYLLVQKKINDNKKIFLEKHKIDLIDSQILRDISKNSDYLETQDSFKFSGFNLKNYLDKRLFNDSRLSIFTVITNFLKSSSNLVFVIQL